MVSNGLPPIHPGKFLRVTVRCLKWLNRREASLSVIGRRGSGHGAELANSHSYPDLHFGDRAQRQKHGQRFRPAVQASLYDLQ